MKQDQSGRSMLEALAVLAIIVLISMGGLYFWNKTQLANQTQTLAQRLISIKNSRILSMSAHSGEKMPRKEKGPYDTQISIENGVDENNKDLFWITVETINVSLCDSLAEYDIGAKSIENNCEENKITFNFLKVPENASESDDSEDNEPSDTNPENGNLTECEEGNYLKDGQCVECPEHYETCGDDDFTCQDGYYKKDGACAECGENVKTCNDNGEPTECEEGYYLNDNKCKSCGTGVAECDNTGKPTKCEEGYYLKDGQCVECGENVKTCNDNGEPTECEEGYKLDGNNCVEDDGCGENQCCLAMLNSGYVLDKTNSNANGTFSMKDNETISYNGILNIEKDLDISECNLSFSDQSILQVSVSEGKTLRVNSILIRSDGNNEYAYSVKNYGTIYSDSLTTNASIVNKGTLNISDIDASAQILHVGITNNGTINSDNITVVGEEESFEITGTLQNNLYAIYNAGTITATNKINVKAATGLNNSGKLSAKNITCSIFSGPITVANGVFTPETCISNSNSTSSTVKLLEATNIKIEKGNLKNDGSLQASKIEIKNGGLYNVYGEATIGTLIAYGGEYGLASCGECNCGIGSSLGNITNAYLQGSKKAYCQGFHTGTIQNLYYCGSAGRTDMSIVNEVNDCSWVNN